VIGQTISHYRITEKLGEGGMGLVYKAEDTRLERTVALKFLAAHLLNNEDAKQRFLREAKASAALHHANICPVYEIDDADGRTFISMAFIQAETLEERIAKGPLPIKDALDIARQVAEGLQAAHDKGIVHRDIKPANVLVAKDGHVTIMDFGLARLTEASRLTKVDTVMGTVAYMSPEQARGIEVDHRSDVWALGCVLYEMVAGVRPFKGEYDQALLYEIVQQEPEPLTSVRAGVPMELEFIVGKCLAKDKDDRTGTAQEVSRELRTLGEKLKSSRSAILPTARMSGALPAVAGQTLNPAASWPPDSVIMPRSRQRLLLGLLGVVSLAVVVLGILQFTESPGGEPEKHVRRFSFTHDSIGAATISPDGRSVAFTALTKDGSYSLWLRPLERETARELPGTDGSVQWAGGWSLDSRSILFGANEQLKRVAVDGGDPVTLCELPDHGAFPFIGAAYSLDGGEIVFSSGLKLWEIPARGGEPDLLVEPDGPDSFYWRPQFLPKGGGSRYLI
jgi:serine/threonine protein kinase